MVRPGVIARTPRFRNYSAEPAAEGAVTWYDHLTLAFTPKQRRSRRDLPSARWRTLRYRGAEGIAFQVTTYRQGIDARISDLRACQTDPPGSGPGRRTPATVRPAGPRGCVTAEQNGRALRLTWEHEPNGTFHRLVADSATWRTASRLSAGTVNGSTEDGRTRVPRYPPWRASAGEHQITAKVSSTPRSFRDHWRPAGCQRPGDHRGGETRVSIDNRLLLVRTRLTGSTQNCGRRIDERERTKLARTLLWTSPSEVKPDVA